MDAKKKNRKFFKLLVAGAVLVLIGLFAAVWIPAGITPEEFKPVRDLSGQQKEAISKQFVRNVILDFRNRTQRGEPFVWQVSQETINQYLASIDEIAYLRMGKSRGEMERDMRKVGLMNPVIDLHDGGFLFMIEASKVSKVLSADVQIQSLEGGQIKSQITKTRIGKLSVPQKVLTGRINKLCDEIIAANNDGQYADGWVEVLAALCAGRPITPEDIWEINSIRVAIDSIEITDDTLTLHVRPIRPVR